VQIVISWNDARICAEVVFSSICNSVVGWTSYWPSSLMSFGPLGCCFGCKLTVKLGPLQRSSVLQLQVDSEVFAFSACYLECMAQCCGCRPTREPCCWNDVTLMAFRLQADVKGWGCPLNHQSSSHWARLAFVSFVVCLLVLFWFVLFYSQETAFAYVTCSTCSAETSLLTVPHCWRVFQQ
jgi:hypothetical protein